MLYYILFSLLYILSLLPLWVLYRISDCLYGIVYYVVRYRRKLVRKNLSDSFPEKPIEEIVRIEKGFYSWFCDYMVETIKMFSMSESEMKRRMEYVDTEPIADDIRNGTSVTVYLGHYGNWEWISSLPLAIPVGYQTQLYHPLENEVADRLFLYMRGRFKAESLEMKEAFRILYERQKEGRYTFTGYIADQAPGFDSMHYWPMFLNHDTPAYTGAERIARILDTPVYYIDIDRPRRGHYKCTFVKICDKPADLPKFEITERYFRLLEDNIKRKPEFWLWSHNRWKRTREQFNKVHSEEERKRILSKL